MPRSKIPVAKVSCLPLESLASSYQLSVSPPSALKILFSSGIKYKTISVPATTV